MWGQTDLGTGQMGTSGWIEEWRNIFSPFKCHSSANFSTGNILKILYDWLYDFIKIWRATPIRRDNAGRFLTYSLSSPFKKRIFLNFFHPYWWWYFLLPDRMCTVQRSLFIFCSPVKINKTQENIPEYWTPRTREHNSRLPRILIMTKNVSPLL